MDISEYLGLFLDESRENLQTLNASLLGLERDPADGEALATIFRVAHSLKGMSATMGFDAMARLTHRMESVLSALRDDGIAVSGETVDALFACLDMLQEMVDRVASGEQEEVDDAPLVARLEGLSAGPAALAGAETAATAAPEAPATASEGGLRLTVAFEPSCALPAARAVMVLRELEAVAEILRSEPADEDLMTGDLEGGLVVWLAGAADADEARAAVMAVSDVAGCEVAVPAVTAVTAAPAGPVAAPGSEAAGPRAPRPAATVRVGADRLDDLLNLMGEMVLQRTRLDELAAREGAPELRAAVEELGRVADDLQALVMQVRMTPVDAVFMRFPRMVRDLAHTLGKRVELVVSGEETELDRTIIDELGDPLVHMLRNAVDHGLETPEEREAAGKDPVGTISLSARHAGSSVAIEVRDDGRGIDPDALRRSAVAKGLLDERAAAALSPDEATALVLMPGFSTAATTTDISGRGVGLDAVNTKIAALGGEVRIASRPGEGSTFTVRLPLTLAIITALLVRAGGAGRVYALPLDVIEETVVVTDDDVRSVRGRPCIVLRDAVVPLVSLHERLGMGGEEPSGRREVVVVRSGQTRVGVAVDALVGQQDIVIKSLPPYLGDTAGLSGATILGDGSVALVVDASALAPRREPSPA